MNHADRKEETHFFLFAEGERITIVYVIREKESDVGL